MTLLMYLDRHNKGMTFSIFNNVLSFFVFTQSSPVEVGISLSDQYNDIQERIISKIFFPAVIELMGAGDIGNILLITSFICIKIIDKIKISNILH